MVKLDLVLRSYPSIYKAVTYSHGLILQFGLCQSGVVVKMKLKCELQPKSNDGLIRTINY